MKPIQVVKVGGAALADPQWLNHFAQQAQKQGRAMARVIVHGGGPEVSALSRQLGIEVEWSNGRRVTSHAALDVASMVLSGRINKRIVRALNLAGLDAIGISGEDGGLIRARVAENGALGQVGEVVAVRRELIARLLEAGLVPVVSPISLDLNGGALNVNADEAATAIARAVDARELLYLTDVPGVRTASGELDSVGASEARELIATGVATGGMALKLTAALTALDAGVPIVRVGSLAMLNDAEAGTRVRREEVIACP